MGGVVEGLSLTKAQRRRGLELGEGMKKKGKQARIKALGNSTRVLSGLGGGGGGQQQCSNKTKEGYGLGDVNQLLHLFTA